MFVGTGVGDGPGVAVLVAVGVLLGVGVLVGEAPGSGVFDDVLVAIAPPNVAVGPASISFKMVRAVEEVSVWSGIIGSSGTIGE